MYGLLIGPDAVLAPQHRVGSMESGTLLCRAYEAYLELHAPARISFDTHGFCCSRLPGATKSEFRAAAAAVISCAAPC